MYTNIQFNNAGDRLLIKFDNYGGSNSCFYLHEISATDGTIINSLKYSITKSSYYSWYGSILYDQPDAYVLMADVYVQSGDTQY